MIIHYLCIEEACIVSCGDIKAYYLIPQRAPSIINRHMHSDILSYAFRYFVICI